MQRFDTAAGIDGSAGLNNSINNFIMSTYVVIKMVENKPVELYDEEDKMIWVLQGEDVFNCSDDWMGVPLDDSITEL